MLAATQPRLETRPDLPVAREGGEYKESLRRVQDHKGEPDLLHVDQGGNEAYDPRKTHDDCEPQVEVEVCPGSARRLVGALSRIIHLKRLNWKVNATKHFSKMMKIIIKPYCISYLQLATCPLGCHFLEASLLCNVQAQSAD